MQKILLMTCLLLSFNILADEDMKDPLEGFSVNQTDVQKSLETMKANGSITNEDYDKASRDLASMNPAQMRGLTETAIGMVRNDPDKAVELTKGKLNEKAVEAQVQQLSHPKD